MQRLQRVDTSQPGPAQRLKKDAWDLRPGCNWASFLGNYGNDGFEAKVIKEEELHGEAHYWELYVPILPVLADG